MAGVSSYRVNFDQIHPGRAYLATSERGLFVINDGGQSGRTVGSSHRAFDEDHTFHETMVSADGQTLIGAGVRHETNRTVIIRSNDGGATWTKLERGLPENYDGITRAVMSLDDTEDFLLLLGSRLEDIGRYHDMGPGGGRPNSPGLYRTTNGAPVQTSSPSAALLLRASIRTCARARTLVSRTRWCQRQCPLSGFTCRQQDSGTRRVAQQRWRHQLGVAHQSFRRAIYSSLYGSSASFKGACGQGARNCAAATMAAARGMTAPTSPPLPQ